MKRRICLMVVVLCFVCCISFSQNSIENYPMIWISPGTFLMGSNQGPLDERPPHEVSIGTGFWLGTFEVTQALWVSVMGTNPSYSPGCSDCPVEYVSWNDAQLFIQTLNNLTGENYRLPTEAELEYAARAGTDTEYYWGTNLGDVDFYAWNRENCSSTQPVGSLLPNAWGLFDMTGNVWELCQDWYDDAYYSYSPSNDPQGPQEGEKHVIRGGSWASGLNNMRVARRYALLPDEFNYWTGLRLAKDEILCSYGPADEPLTFVRQTGPPTTESVEWESCGGMGRIEIANDGVTSAEIFLNGILIAGPDLFKKNIVAITLEIDLFEGMNVLEVELRGKPGRQIQIVFVE